MRASKLQVPTVEQNEHRFFLKLKANVTGLPGGLRGVTLQVDCFVAKDFSGHTVAAVKQGCTV